jgi:uracil-DNA glycosylase
MKLEFEDSWKSILGEEIDKPYFHDLKDKLAVEYASADVWPKEKELLNAFNSCPFSEVKVVILGQDPFPTPSHAHGLCFSNPETIIPFSKSLQNIFKEIKSDLNQAPPKHGNLQRWANQGVFLLNTVLSVRAHDANSHKKIGWQEFTDKVIEKISSEREGVVFLLWGSQAQKKSKLIDNQKHDILNSVHPSPLSAYRGFFGCKHFSKANELLISRGLEPIKW